MNKLDLTLLQDLLVPSYDGNYNVIVQTIISFLDTIPGVEIIIQPISENKCNVIAVTGNPDTVINCHMDTVPPNDGWSTNPTELVHKDGKLYGLGATDTKGNIYTVLQSFAAVRPKNLMLLFSTDEETGGYDSGVYHFLNSSYSQPIQTAIVCEPTELKKVNQHKAYYSFDLVFKGKDGHSSCRNHDQNAIVSAAEKIVPLHKAGFQIGRISGGSRGNVIASQCTIRVSYRTYESHDQTENFLQEIVEKKAEIHNRCQLPALKARGVPLREVNFWTEAALFQQAGIESYVLGAGSIQQAHQKNEYIEMSQLIKAQSVFTNLMRKFL